MVTTAMMLPHQQLRDSPITGQSNHSMKGDIFWLRAVPGTCTVHKKAKLEELGWPDLSLCKGEWSRVLSPTALYTPFISFYSDSFHHDRARGNNRLGSAPCFPCRWLHTAWGLMFLALKWIQLFFSRTEGTGGA